MCYPVHNCAIDDSKHVSIYFEEMLYSAPTPSFVKNPITLHESKRQFDDPQQLART